MLTIMCVEDVVDVDTLLEFTRQKFGCPAFIQDEIIFKRQCKEWFARHPEYQVGDLARVVAWAREVGKRPRELATVFHYAKDAYAAGILRGSKDDRALIAEAMYEILEIEEDEQWRFRLMAAMTPAARRDAINDWHRERAENVQGGEALAEVQQEALFGP